MSRETDQVLPTTNDESYSQTTLAERITRSLVESKEIGVQRYGTALQPFNNRDSFRDAYEEWVDLGVYMENLRREREVMIELLHRSADHAGLTQNRGLQRDLHAALLGLGESIVS